MRLPTRPFTALPAAVPRRPASAPAPAESPAAVAHSQAAPAQQAHQPPPDALARKELADARRLGGHCPGDPARNGDTQAWHALVKRYAPLIWSICRRHRLGHADAEDVGQNIWLYLVRHLDTLPGPSRASRLAGHHHPARMRPKVRPAAGPHAAGFLLDSEILPDNRAATADQELLEAERHAALREALAALPPSGQQLIAMLTADPPVPSTEISARLGIPVGSIGPNRSRYLDKMRRHPAIAALINA